MALQQTISNNYGTSCSYWKIGGIECNWIFKHSIVHLLGYINKEARDSGKQPLDRRIFSFGSENFPFSPDLITGEDVNIISKAYTAIKSYPRKDANKNPIDPEFAQAVDC